MAMTLMTAMTMNTESAIMSHVRAEVGLGAVIIDMICAGCPRSIRIATPAPMAPGKRDGLRGLGVGHEVLAIGEHDIGRDELAARAKADEECEDRNHEAPCERVAHARPHEQAHRELANPRRATYRHEDDGHDDGPLA